MPISSMSDFLHKYRSLVARGEKAKLQRLLLLVDLKPLLSVWHRAPYTSWTALLRAEQLCPVNYFNKFEEALELFRPATLERIGPDAAVTLTRVEVHLREPTLDKINQYIRDFHFPPSSRMIWSFVRALRQIPITVHRGGVTSTATRH